MAETNPQSNPTFRSDSSAKAESKRRLDEAIAYETASNERCANMRRDRDEFFRQMSNASIVPRKK